MINYRFSVILALIISFSSSAQVGIGTATPNSSAQLEVSSSTKGFLPPRVSLTATNSTSPITSPEAGLLVYNQATAGVYPNNVVQGYYYYDGSRWQRMSNGQMAEVPAWVDAGAITFGATSTVPTFGTTTKNKMYYRQLGQKEWEVAMSFNTTGVGGVAGNGDYLFTLPNGLSFDNTLPWQTIYTANSAAFSTDFFRYAIPMSFGFMASTTNGYNSTTTYIVPYSSTKFRIVIYVHGSSGTAPWGAGWFPLTYNLGGNWTFRFTSL